MLTHYNFQHLIKINVLDATENDSYVFRKEIKLLGIILRKAGVYHWFRRGVIPLPNNCFIKDNIVYEHPKCILFFFNDYKQVFYFNSYKEACIYSEEIRKQPVRWLEAKISI